jgi:PleD family two-component response regulator
MDGCGNYRRNFIHVMAGCVAMNATREIGNSSKPGTRVLLVEDHSDSAKAMARLLRTFGFQVEITYRLAEARAAARAGKFDLIICDIALPDGSGLDLMRELRLRRTRRRPKQQRSRLQRPRRQTHRLHPSEGSDRRSRKQLTVFRPH